MKVWLLMFALVGLALTAGAQTAQTPDKITMHIVSVARHGDGYEAVGKVKTVYYMMHCDIPSKCPVLHAGLDYRGTLSNFASGEDFLPDGFGSFTSTNGKEYQVPFVVDEESEIAPTAPIMQRKAG
jgi:hypothetical protein